MSTLQDVDHYVTKVRLLSAEAGIEVVRSEAVAPPCVQPRIFGERHHDAAGFWFKTHDEVLQFERLAIHVRDIREEFGCSWGNYGRLMSVRSMLNDIGLISGYFGKAVPYADLPLLVTALQREIAAQRIAAERPGWFRQIRQRVSGEVTT